VGCDTVGNRNSRDSCNVKRFANGEIKNTKSGEGEGKNLGGLKRTIKMVGENHSYNRGAKYPIFNLSRPKGEEEGGGKREIETFDRGTMFSELEGRGWKRFNIRTPGKIRTYLNSHSWRDKKRKKTRGKDQVGK